MRQTTTILHVHTPGPGLHPIDDRVEHWLASSQTGLGMRVARAAGGEGLLTIFCQHTSASLAIQENADPDVRSDLEDAVAALAPHGRVPTTDRPYRHAAEGPDDMAAHLRTVLTGVQLAIPIIGGALALGQWQGLYLWEHRDRGQHRRLALHLLIG
ncbi:MAG: secondary thiamine-phosphate synthase enzyme YjbQ [Pseudomonadota bacterium]